MVCEKCGGKLSIIENYYVCEYCGEKYPLKTDQDINHESYLNNGLYFYELGNFKRADYFFQKSAECCDDEYVEIMRFLCDYQIVFSEGERKGYPFLFNSSVGNPAKNEHYIFFNQITESLYGSMMQDVFDYTRQVYELSRQTETVYHHAAILYDETDQDSAEANSKLMKAFEQSGNTSVVSVALKEKNTPRDNIEILNAVNGVSAVVLLYNITNKKRPIFQGIIEKCRIAEKDRNLTLLPVVVNGSVTALPAELSKYQAIEFRSVTGLNNIVNTINSSYHENDDIVLEDNSADIINIEIVRKGLKNEDYENTERLAQILVRVDPCEEAFDLLFLSAMKYQSFEELKNDYTKLNAGSMAQTREYKRVISKCQQYREKYSQFAESCFTESLYMTAVFHKKVKEYQEAKDIFEQIKDYKNSQDMLNDCIAKLKAIEEEKEREEEEKRRQKQESDNRAVVATIKSKPNEFFAKWLENTNGHKYYKYRSLAKKEFDLRPPAYYRGASRLHMLFAIAAGLFLIAAVGITAFFASQESEDLILISVAKSPIVFLANIAMMFSLTSNFFFTESPYAEKYDTCRDISTLKYSYRDDLKCLISSIIVQGIVYVLTLIFCIEDVTLWTGISVIVGGGSIFLNGFLILARCGELSGYGKQAKEHRQCLKELIEYRNTTGESLSRQCNAYVKSQYGSYFTDYTETDFRLVITK